MRWKTRLLLGLASLFMLVVPSHGQEKPKEDPGAAFRNMALAHYDSRVRFFRSENNAMSTVVLLGDSITEGFDVAKWFPFRRVLNRGIGSDTIGVVPVEKDRRGVLRRLDTSVFDCATSHVFLMIGVNDLGETRPLDQMRAGYRVILETIRQRTPGVTVHVQSLLPTRGRFSHLNERVVEVNQVLRELAAEFNYPYVDLHSHFTDDKGELREEFTRDGLHITEPGYAVWKEQIGKAMGWE